MSTQEHAFLIGTNVTLTAGAVLQYWPMDNAGTIISCQLDAESAGTGGDFVIDVLKNGASQFGTKPQLDSGDTTGTSQAATGGNTFAAGDIMKITVVSVGTVAPTRICIRLRVNYTGANVNADNLVGTPGNAMIYGTSEAGAIAWRPGRMLLEYVKTYSDFSDPSTSKSVTLVTLPAGTVVHTVKAKHSTAFSGGGITAYTIKVGIAGTTDKHLTAFNVFQAAGGTVIGINSPNTAETHNVGGVAILATATSTTANLDQAAAGSVTIWIEYSVMN